MPVFLVTATWLCVSIALGLNRDNYKNVKKKELQAAITQTNTLAKAITFH